MDSDTYDYICTKLQSIDSQMNQLLEQQFVSNLMAVASNMNVPEETRKEALDRALNMMPLVTQIREKKEDDLGNRFL